MPSISFSGSSLMWWLFYQIRVSDGILNTFFSLNKSSGITYRHTVTVLLLKSKMVWKAQHRWKHNPNMLIIHLALKFPENEIIRSIFSSSNSPTSPGTLLGRGARSQISSRVTLTGKQKTEFLFFFYSNILPLSSDFNNLRQGIKTKQPKRHKKTQLVLFLSQIVFIF